MSLRDHQPGRMAPMARREDPTECIGGVNCWTRSADRPERSSEEYLDVRSGGGMCRTRICMHLFREKAVKHLCRKS